ncbi:TPA: hypothetical protein N0F65_009883 [Lagenidium giganteum]|uniref:Uncharacterized protein n=1 Tax=Lagenidium giganteum TaxID=4803 RepID=A0AAV2YQZ6_9STRA|nr:TPA: hypothetical protein N0F65_009883 [Lagenidium giganteum]
MLFVASIRGQASTQLAKCSRIRRALREASVLPCQSFSARWP